MISVVIPVYNRPEELARALNSLTRQTNRTFEVLVCDDGSDKDVKSVAASFMTQLNLRYLTNIHSGTPSLPRNIGIANASGEWVSFLDSDDWWSPKRIEVVSSVLSKGVDILYHPLKVARAHSSILAFPKYVGRPIYKEPFADMLSRGNPIPLSASIVRRSLLENRFFQLGLSSLSFEDLDIWLSLARAGAKFIFINRPLGYYWVGSNNISSANDAQIYRLRGIYLKHTINISKELTYWAHSFNNYVEATYLIKLKRPRAALSALRKANKLRYACLRLKRSIKIILIIIWIAKIKLMGK